MLYFDFNQLHKGPTDQVLASAQQVALHEIEAAVNHEPPDPRFPGISDSRPIGSLLAPLRFSCGETAAGWGLQSWGLVLHSLTAEGEARAPYQSTGARLDLRRPSAELLKDAKLASPAPWSRWPTGRGQSVGRKVPQSSPEAPGEPSAPTGHDYRLWVWI